MSQRIVINKLMKYETFRACGLLQVLTNFVSDIIELFSFVSKVSPLQYNLQFNEDYFLHKKEWFREVKQFSQEYKAS